MTPLTIISRALVAGGLAGARPALTLLCLQLAIVLLTDGSGLPEGFGWLLHYAAIAAVAAMALLEHFARTDPDLDEALEIPNAIVGVVIAAMLPVLLPALDSAEAGGAEPAPTAEASPLVARAGIIDSLRGSQGAAIIASIAASLLLLWVRRRVLTALGTLSLSQRYYRWTETGVIVGSMAVLALLPALAVALAVVVVVGSITVGGVLWLMGRQRDELYRHPCPGCGRKVRKEATVCPECQADLDPPRKLG